MLPGLRPIKKVNSTDDVKQLVTEINQAITEINVAIETIKVFSGKIGNSNIPGLNFLPLKADALTPLTGVTPLAGFLQALTVSGLKELLLYDGAAWQELARHDMVYNVFASLALGNYTHSHGGNTGSGTSGAASAGTAHTHPVGPLTISVDVHTHTVSYNTGL